MKNNASPALGLLLLLFAMSCGGGGESVGSQLAGGGIGGTGGTETVYSGTIAQFGSIYVNGIKFDVSRASFSINNGIGSESDLHVGMLVYVRGSLGSDGGTGSASNVEFRHLAIGTVGAIDANNRSLVVSGRSVSFDELTDFRNTSSSTLSVGDKVQLSGYEEAAGSIKATFIHKVDTLLSRVADAGSLESVSAQNTQVEIVGPIQTVLVDSKFFIRHHPIEVHSGTTFLEGSVGDMVVGKPVEVKGVIGAERSIRATTIRVLSIPEVIMVAQLESVDPAARTLKIMGQTVKVDNSTIFRDLLSDVRRFSLDSLAANEMLEMVMVRDSKGILTARHVMRIAVSKVFVLQSRIESVGDSHITLLSNTVAVSASTVYRNNAGAVITRVQAQEHLQTGRLVRASGLVIGDQRIATTVRLVSGGEK